MGYTFHSASGPVCGTHAVENLLRQWRATPLRAGCSAIPPTLQPTVSCVRYQPDVWLPVAAALPAGRARRSAPALAPATHFAAAHTPALARRGAAPAQAASALGRQKDPCPPAAQVPPRSPARRAHDYQMVAPLVCHAPPPPAYAARSAPDVAAADAAHGPQRRVDGGLQRGLPHPRRQAVRSTDRARPLQPLPLGRSDSAGPASTPCAARVSGPVPALRFAQGDPHGQWLALRQHGSPGALGPERVVVELGHSGRVHPAWPSRGEWRA